MALSDKVDQFTTDADIVHQIVHGSETATVETEGGTVPSVAKVIHDNEQKISGSRDSIQSIADDAAASKTAAEASAAGADQAKRDAVAVVTGGTASQAPAPGKLPIAGDDAAFSANWLRATDLPKIRPAASFPFAAAEFVDPRIVHSRASAAWERDRSGNLVEVPANVPRLAFDPVTGLCKGILIEPARTNRVTRNHSFPDLSGFAGSAVTSGLTSIVDDAAALNASGLGTIAGNLTAIKIDNSSGASTVYLQFPGSADFATPHVVSAFLRGTGQGGVGRVNGSSGQIALKDTTYQRAEWTDVGAGVPTGRFSFVSALPGSIVYAVLAQIEEGSSPTSPIPTAGSQVTRAAEDCVMPLAPGRTPARGFFFFDFYAPEQIGLAEYPAIFSLANDSGTASVQLWARHDGRFVISGAGVPTIVLPGASLKFGQRHRLALSYNGDTFKVSVNGAPPVSGSAEIYSSTRTRLRLGRNRLIATEMWNGAFADVRHYPGALSDAELIALTK